MDKNKKLKKIKELEEELKKLKNEVKVSVDLSRLDKYIGKYLYFEGYENGSVICRFDKFILTDEGGISYEGLKYDLNTENNYEGPGITIDRKYCEDDCFSNFPYFENDYDFDTEDDTIDGFIDYLDRWLSYGEYGESVTGSKTSRELKPEQVLEVINDHLKNYLPTEITGGDWCEGEYE